MALLRKIGTLKNLPAGILILFAHTVLISAFVRFTLLFLPFRKVLAWLGTVQKETDTEMDLLQMEYARKVQTAVTLCNKYTPWKTECYVQALTGRMLLNRKQIPSTVYIGFRKDKDGEFEGHAWLRSGRIIVTGNKNHRTFQVHSFFS